MLHSERYSLTTILRKMGVVVHDSESGDLSHDALVSALASPGDRIIEGSNPPRRYGSGYHAITDGLGGYTTVASANMGPYAAPPLNKTYWHVCMPGRAAQTRAEWLDTASRAHIRGVAQFVVDKAKIDGFPFHDLSMFELRNGQLGYCSHWEVSLAFNQSTHTDPGAWFPWDVLAEDIADIAADHPMPAPELPVTGPDIPWEDDDMNRLIRPNDGDLAVLVVSGTEASSAVSPQVIEDMIDAQLLPPRIAVNGQPGKPGDVKAWPVKNVPRRMLKGFTFKGALPDYSQSPPGPRTTHADFMVDV